MTSKTADARDLFVHRKFAAPVSAVWEAWSRPEDLAEWWCPRPWRTEILAYDFRAGGDFIAKMYGPEPEGGESGVDGMFLLIEPMRQIIWTTGLVSGWRPAHEPFIPLTAIVTMKPDGKGTDYHIQVKHQSVEGAKAHEDMGFSEGWETCVTQLGEVAARLAKIRS